jgi:hypothetical protein
MKKISIYFKFLFYNLNYSYSLRVSARNVHCARQCRHSLYSACYNNLMLSYCRNIQDTVLDVVLIYHVNLHRF